MSDSLVNRVIAVLGGELMLIIAKFTGLLDITLLDVHHIPQWLEFSIFVGKVAVTATIGGFCGMLGKWIWGKITKK